MIIIGIDPGAGGAIVSCNYNNSKLIDIEKCPSTAGKMSE